MGGPGSPRHARPLNGALRKPGARHAGARNSSPAGKLARSIRAEYQDGGVESYYRQHGSAYRNPHEGRIRAALEDALTRHPVAPNARILDLCCGSGEITLQLVERGHHEVEGADPFTQGAYLERTGKTAMALDFDAIARGALLERRYDLVVCSFALHLLEPSRLPEVVWQLSLSTTSLIVLTPHKRPHIEPAWGFTCVDERVVSRVRVRVYLRTLPSG